MTGCYEAAATIPNCLGVSPANRQPLTANSAEGAHGPTLTLWIALTAGLACVLAFTTAPRART